ncbi:hypothetical protein F5883DRAFT_32916 [Diaporthe sp. PMI_573]|nr:hypothetical protein F5883DRAFT_40450 [Diaporthaceae sp. PMI_573]KAH8743823.1 hypothetical protein F5883DRAFT_32916 [Diaporthaceae sp. PMI_573]
MFNIGVRTVNMSELVISDFTAMAQSRSHPRLRLRPARVSLALTHAGASVSSCSTLATSCCAYCCSCCHQSSRASPGRPCALIVNNSTEAQGSFLRHGLQQSSLIQVRLALTYLSSECHRCCTGWFEPLLTLDPPMPIAQSGFDMPPVQGRYASVRSCRREGSPVDVGQRSEGGRSGGSRSGESRSGSPAAQGTGYQKLDLS